ncbi:ParA family partition ATPase [Acidiphilium acidophilum]|uniref:ParA family partition ATPase n=1 Tax=Acidiphilium acidophilum TaxID=76588 RepID=UPI002E8E6B4A|nr:ParA family partition ATPase [Acidiphilium acidophilum]
MKVIAFLSQKGGAGKTTLAVHTAVAAYEAGFRVVLIDTDPQKSATVWGEARQEEGPVIATADVADLKRVLEAARGDGMKLAIVDAAPHAAPAAAGIARAADLVAIPCRPTAFDLAAVEGAVRIVKAVGAKAVFILSACPFRAPEIAETRDALGVFGLPVAPVEITDRRAFARAVASGRAVTEFETDGKAAGEIRALWSWLQEQMA